MEGVVGSSKDTGNGTTTATVSQLAFIQKTFDGEVNPLDFAFGQKAQGFLHELIWMTHALTAKPCHRNIAPNERL